MDPLKYKKMYLDRCTKESPDRLEELRDGQARPRSTWCPARALCSKRCKQRGLRMYLASGTDQEYMREEAQLAGRGDVLRRRRLRCARRL